MSHAVSESRLLWLKLSQWSLLIVGAGLCGFLRLLF